MAGTTIELEVAMESFIDTLPHFTTPAFLISLVATLLSPYCVSPLLWRAVLPSNRVPPGSNMHFHTMLSSTVHAIISSSLSVYILWFGLMGTNRIFSKLPLGFTMMQISLGYFVGDFIVCFCDPKLRSDKRSMIHHLVGIFGLFLGLYLQGKGMFFIVYRLTSELSTPFVNLRSILSDLGLKGKNIPYIFAGISMLITFFLCRVIVIPWHWYEILITVTTKECELLIPPFFSVWLGITYLVFDVLNVYWWWRMVRGASKLLSSGSNTLPVKTD